MVLLGIANHDGDGGSWPAVATLSDYADIEPRAVQKIVVKLIQLGEISRDIQAGGTAGTAHYDRPNLYHFTLKCPPNCDGSSAHRLICKSCGKKMPKKGSRGRLYHPACEPTSATADRVAPGASPVLEATAPASPETPKPSLELPINYPPADSLKPAYVGNRASAHDAELVAGCASCGARWAAGADPEQFCTCPEVATAQAPEIDAYGDSHRPAGASTAASPINSPRPSTDELERDPNACPRWRNLPHTPDAHGTCIDCGASVPGRVNASTGETHE